MKFGIFYEHQLPRPWEPGAELRLFQDALDQVELADRLGIDLMPPGYNPPARVAERVATLDLVSKGRVDFGTGESASRAELEGFGITPAERRAMWRETVEQVANMMVMDPYPGYQGKYFSMPVRNVMPKPVQKPHPPLWVACSNRHTIHLAAQLGIGALTFAFIDPDEARHWVADYYETFKKECVPVGHAVNPNIAMVTGFSCHKDAEEAVRRGMDGFRFFQFALGHHYAFGKHTPGRTNIWKKYEAIRAALDLDVFGGGTGCIGTPAQLRETLRKFQSSGVDQTIFIQQSGKNRHEHICEALELFAKDVMPEFKEDEARRLARKEEELAPYVEAAFKRKQYLEPLADTDIPTYEALGSSIAQIDTSNMPEANRRRLIAFMKMREIAERS